MKYFITYLFILFSFQIFAQNETTSKDVISSAGGHYSEENLQVSWTLGQTVIGSIEKEGVEVNAGFHYAYSDTISRRTANFEMLVYPNPTNSYVNIRIQSSIAVSSFYVEVIDLFGRVIYKRKMGNYLKIDLDFLPKGVYIFHIWNANPNSNQLSENNIVKVIKY